VLVARRRGGDRSAEITLERGVHTQEMPLRHLLMQRAADFGARTSSWNRSTIRDSCRPVQG
jgi:hypothetical protein